MDNEEQDKDIVSFDADTIKEYKPSSSSKKFRGYSGISSIPDIINAELMHVDTAAKYVFVKNMAEGGMKNIVKVIDNNTSRCVAMALLSDKDCEDGEHRYRFIQEAKITANLEHPNIIPVHEIGLNEKNVPYFTMKLVEGATLGQIISHLRNGDKKYLEEYTLNRLIQIFQRVCQAVAFAHSKGIVHLDLKPDNILVGNFGEVLVLDWGLAKYINTLPEFAKEGTQGEKAGTDNSERIFFTPENISLTEDGEIKGTFGYMAPEQAEGRNEDKDERTDIYALGAILYTILTYRRPIEEADVDTMLDNIIGGNFQPPSKRTPENHIPMALELITLKAMETEQEDRYQSVNDLLKDIDAFTSGYATSAENAGLIKILYLWLKRNRKEAVFGAIIIMALVTIAGLWMSYRIKRYAGWGIGTNITPVLLDDFKLNWFARKGNWVLKNGALIAEGGKGDTFKFYYNTPVYGNIAIEFDAMSTDKAQTPKDGDLSIVFTGGEDMNKHYYFQIGAVNNTCAMISKRGTGEELYGAVSFRVRRNRIYHVRIEKENERLRLFCDGKKLVELKDIFYIDSGYIGLYTFGNGKKFWNIRLYRKGVPELVSALSTGDAFFRESRSAPEKIRPNLLKYAKDAYDKVYKSHPDSPIGKQALIKHAYVSMEMNDISAAEKDAELLYKKDKDNLDGMILRGDIAFSEHQFHRAYKIYSEALRLYPGNKIMIIGTLMGKLSRRNSAIMDTGLLMNYWRMCAKSQECAMFRCRNRDIPSLEFLKGLDFRILDCSDNAITSLAPLQGMKLSHLDCDNNKITSLEPLKGMQITHLECAENPIKSIEPLRGMPLKALSLYNCRYLTDITPLKDCITLEKLIIPAHIKNIEFLKELPNLKYLDIEWKDGWTTPAKEFWEKYEKTKR